MKKALAIILCCAMMISVTACSENNSNNTEATVTSTEANVETTQAIAETISEDTKEKLAKKLDNFEGIVYLTHNGSVIYSQSIGKDECGNDLTVDTPMYIGSVSKQFCASAIMILKEQGKLSVDDTLDKYFPEYELGKDITIKHLLSMRSGIPEMHNKVENLSTDKTENENVALIKEWIFEQSLEFEPDSQMVYSNTNYFLLGNIVEIVSGQRYNDFIRENIFTPLEMNNSGFVDEVKDNDFFSSSLTYNTFAVNDDAKGVTKGAGDIVTTAPDIDKWMTGLVNGKIVSRESYEEMTADYSPDMGTQYGYGMMGMYKKGKGHSGHIGNYGSLNYINEEYGYNLFAVTTGSEYALSNMPMNIMNILVEN